MNKMIIQTKSPQEYCICPKLNECDVGDDDMKREFCLQPYFFECGHFTDNIPIRRIETDELTNLPVLGSGNNLNIEFGEL